MTIELLIARHGNTLLPGEPARRVGARTDAPLVESDKAKAIGRYLQLHDFTPDRIFSSPLKRTFQTAGIALEAAGLSHLPIETDEIFREIDYGPDENQKESEVIDRLGEEAIRLWNERAIPPNGWIVDPQQIERDWLAFAHDLVMNMKSGKVLVVTSNGIARFSPILCGDQAKFMQTYNIDHLKVGTGHLCQFTFSVQAMRWENRFWNVNPM